MSHATLNFNNIRNKKALVKLYIGQYRERYILSEINIIIKAERTGIPEEKRIMIKNISSKEALIFIWKYGAPDGFVLSQEMQIKLTELKRDLALQRVGNKIETHED